MSKNLGLVLVIGGGLLMALGLLKKKHEKYGNDDDYGDKIKEPDPDSVSISSIPLSGDEVMYTKSDGEQMIIKCGPGHLFIDKAVYMTTDLSVQKDVTSLVQSLAYEKNVLDINVGPHTLGIDPAPGKPKKLVVHARCVELQPNRSF